MNIRLRIIKTGLSALLFLSAAIPAHAENLRGEVAGSVGFSGTSVTFRPEQLVIVSAESLGNFHAGIELKIDIPSELRRFQNSFALFIYRGISPSPTLQNPSYDGSRVFMRLLPARESLFVRIPMSSNHGLSGDALTDVVPVPVPANDFPLLITVQPMSKGLPDSVFNRTLRIKAAPLVKNEGSLTVNIESVSGSADETISVSIDGMEAEIGRPAALEAGLHSVRVDSSHAPAVEQTVAVEPGEEKVLSVSLDYRPPALVIEIPQGVRVFLDGSLLDMMGPVVELTAAAGEHVVTYVIGDLRVERAFTLIPGGKQNIRLIFDIDIKDFGDGSP